MSINVWGWHLESQQMRKKNIWYSSQNMIKTHAKNHPTPKSVVQLIEWPNLRNLSWSLAGHQHRFFWVAQLHCQQKQPNSVWQAHFATPPLDGLAFSPYLSEVKLWSWRICADIVMNIYGLWIRHHFFPGCPMGSVFFSGCFIMLCFRMTGFSPN